MRAWITIDGAERPLVVDYQKQVHIDFNPADQNRSKKPTDWVHPEGFVEIEWDYAGKCVGVNLTVDQSMVRK